MRLTLPQVAKLIAPATVRDLEGELEVEAPQGLVSTGAGLHCASYEYKDKRWPSRALNPEMRAEWANLPSRSERLRDVVDDWSELSPCTEPDCEICEEDHEPTG